MTTSMRYDSWMMAVVLAGAQLMSLPAVAVAVVAPADPQGDPQAFAERRSRAEEQRAAGRYSESARSFASAYDALSEREQAGLKGEIAVSNAVDDFKLAQEQAPEELALLAEEVALLERFEGNPKRKEAMPVGLAEELARVKARVEEVRRVREEAAAAEERRKAEEQRKAEEAAKAEEQRKAQTGADDRVEVLDDEPPPRRKGGAAILGVGVASMVGGVALVASGAWNLGNVRRRGDELLATIEAEAGGTPEMRDALRGEVEAWRKDWRGIGTGLVVGGAVLAAAGVGLATWGVVRMRRGKPRAGKVSVVRPMVSGRGFGFVVMGRW
jgi:hypothetical protein